MLPVNAAKTEQLVKSIEDTNSFIELEKERVHKGIEDMERIKDNFENRCIQTCCNIKTELERLPKLSHIRMDNEDIAIIGLYIPYVREEMYKDRMSAYIDETIVAAASFFICSNFILNSYLSTLKTSIMSMNRPSNSNNTAY